MMPALSSIVVVPIGRLLWPPIAWLRWVVWSALILAIVDAIAAASMTRHIVANIAKDQGV
jgi:hypothetical protein